MRILILNTSDSTGGAAIAAHRLLHALDACGIEARMLVKEKLTDDALVYKAKDKNLSKAIDRARVWIANGFTKDKLWLTDAGFHGCRITTHPLFRWADTIHLHWVNQGFLSLDEIDNVLHSGKRVVWTMHDMWPVTGICHHAVDCAKFHTPRQSDTLPNNDGCHHCEQLCRPSVHDLSTHVFRKKRKMYADATITFVACSRWLAEEAHKSALAQGQTVANIPNAIDTNTFSPTIADREAFHLPKDKQLILFSSLNVSDERKGMSYLVKAMQSLKDLRDTTEIVIVGKHSETAQHMFPFRIHTIPYQTDTISMASLNASVDVFVTPSLQENLPNTIMEAMSCGVPCVGFNVGGIPEMIEHGSNGYVAQLRDANDLANGIRQALAHREEWGRNARDKVLATYSANIITQRYLEIYNSI